MVFTHTAATADLEHIINNVLGQ